MYGYFKWFFLQVISGAGHHIFADKPEVFNEYVNAACRFGDELPENNAGECGYTLERL